MSDPRPLLTLWPNGQASLNRQASRVLPAGLALVRLAPPVGLGSHWRLLPGQPGGHPVRARADRLGSLRFTAPELAAHVFAARPPGTACLRFELVDHAGLFTLRPAA